MTTETKPKKGIQNKSLTITFLANDKSAAELPFEESYQLFLKQGIFVRKEAYKLYYNFYTEGKTNNVKKEKPEKTKVEVEKLKPISFDSKLLDLKKEKSILKTSFTGYFLNDLQLIVEKCFLKSKTKKEHFITKEKIEIELLKLLQSQKKFQPSTSLKTNFKALGVFDVEDSLLGKIKNINFEKNEVEYIDIFCKEKKKSLTNLCFFDIYSLEMQIFFEKQKRFYDAFSYKEIFSFLTMGKKEEKKETPIRIVPVDNCHKIRLTIPMDYNSEYKS